jgi:hypothetical protein
MYREGHVCREEFDREMMRIENRLLTVAPSEVEAVELLMQTSSVSKNWH